MARRRLAVRASGWRRAWGQLVAIAASIALLAASCQVAAVVLTSPTAEAAPASSVRLANSVVPLVARGRLQPTAATQPEKAHSLTLTFTLKRSDQAGFESYLSSVQSPHSPQYRHFLTQGQITKEFGPSLDAYLAALSWAKSQGLRVIQGSKDRLTITVRATRGQAEKALDLPINEYQVDGRSYFANSENPALPASIAGNVESVTGLSNLSQPTAPLPNVRAIHEAFCNVIIQLNNLAKWARYDYTLPGTADCNGYLNSAASIGR